MKNIFNFAAILFSIAGLVLLIRENDFGVMWLILSALYMLLSKHAD